MSIFHNLRKRSILRNIIVEKNIIFDKIIKIEKNINVEKKYMWPPPLKKYMWPPPLTIYTVQKSFHFFLAKIISCLRHISVLLDFLTKMDGPFRASAAILGQKMQTLMSTVALLQFSHHMELLS